MARRIITVPGKPKAKAPAKKAKAKAKTKKKAKPKKAAKGGGARFSKHGKQGSKRQKKSRLSAGWSSSESS
jgi:hypothetical protein